MKKIRHSNLAKIIGGNFFKKKFIFLIFFSILISIIESIGVSAIMPFVDITTNLSSVNNNTYYKIVYDLTGFDSEIDFAILFGFILFAFFLFRGGINYIYQYKMSLFSQSIYAKITQTLYGLYMEMPYKKFINKNSSFLSKVVVTEASLFSAAVSSFLLMTSEIFVVIFLYLLMLFASWEVTLVFTLFIIVKSIFLTKTVSKKIKSSGSDRAFYHANIYETLNRTFGNYKHIKLQNKDITSSMKSNFNRVIDNYVYANVTNGRLSILPRLLLETSGFSFIVLILVFLVYKEQGDISYALPTMSLFVLAFYRLLPSINRIFNGFNTIMYNYKSIEIIDNELEIEKDILGNSHISFTRAIELKNLSFSFDSYQVLSGVNIKINKNEKVAIIGKSGSGKSTLVDIIIGLYKPKEGSIEVDGLSLNNDSLQDWRSKIGYIPQHVYLFDGSVSENVVFGRNFHYEKLVDVLRKANIYDFLISKNGIDTMVGEGGCQLSGGQKQRIAIARALYGNPEVIVLDEATSALDEDVERKIMNEIYQISKNKTLIVIAHRLNTIDRCDRVYKVEGGGVYV